MVIIRANISIQQPFKNILLLEVAYDTVRKQTVLPLQENKREFMMTLKQQSLKWQMRTPPPGGTLVRLQESTSLLLKWNNIYRWPRIGEKWMRQELNRKEDSHKKGSFPTQEI